jgi:hypothetical protein
VEGDIVRLFLGESIGRVDIFDSLAHVQIKHHSADSDQPVLRSSFTHWVSLKVSGGWGQYILPTLQGHVRCTHKPRQTLHGPRKAKVLALQ